MRISRLQLSEMIATEIRRRLTELSDASSEDDDDKPKSKKGKPGIASADGEPVRKGPVPVGPHGGESVTGPQDPGAADISGPAVDGDKPDASVDSDSEAGEHDDDQKDTDRDADDALDDDGDAGEEPSGAVNDDISGKTVQGISVEPKSKILPGAKEVVFTFNESTDPLRLLITQSGQVKFFWRNQLHDLP